MSRPYTISLAGDHLHSKGSLMAGLWVGCFPAGLLYGCWVWWTVLKAVTAGEQGAGRAVRVLGTLLALLLVVGWPAAFGILVFGLVQHLLLLAFLGVLGADLLPQIRPGSRLRQRIRRQLGGMFAIALVLMAAGFLPDVPLPLTMMLSVTAFVPLFTGLLRRMWSLPIAPEGIVQAVQEHLPDGLSLQHTAQQIQVTGVLDSQPVSMTICFQLVPVTAVVTVALPPSLHSLTVRARREGDTGGVPLSDMLLSRLLFIEGPAHADAMLCGHHEQLLSVLHAHPDAELADGQLTVPVPLQALIEGESDVCAAIGGGLAVRLKDAVQLIRHLQGRDAQPVAQHSAAAAQHTTAVKSSRGE